MVSDWIVVEVVVSVVVVVVVVVRVAQVGVLPFRIILGHKFCYSGN